MSLDVRINQDGGQPVTEERTAPPTQITVSQIMDDLESGRDRKAIKAKYGLTAEEVKMIFEHPKLKGVRVKKARVVRFTLVDDTPTETTTQVTIGDVIEQLSTETAKLLTTPNLEEAADMLYGVDNNQSEIQD